MKSKIFEEYIKTAKEHGLIKEEDLIKEAAYADARIGSDTEEKIRMMYGVKPNGSEDDTHIIDKAHPDTAVVAPAYDAMNGVVENVKERQNMMAYIALKMPDGHLTGRRYVHYDQKKYESPMDSYREAAGSLQNALIRTGFTMDNKDEDELRVLADSCSGRLRKEALPWGAVAKFVPWGKLLSGAGLMLGYTSIVNNNILSQGVLADLDKAIVELAEAQGEGFANAQHEIASLLQILNHFKTIANQYHNLDPIPLSEDSTPEDLLTIRTSRDQMGKMHMANTYKAAVNQLLAYLPGAITRLKAAAERDEESSTWFAPIAWLGRQIVPSELKDAWTHLEPLNRSLKDESKRINDQMSQGHKESQNVVQKFQAMAEGGIPEGMLRQPQGKPQVGIARTAPPQEQRPPAPRVEQGKVPSEESIEDILRMLEAQ